MRREAGGDPGVAGDVAALLSRLANATADDVVDLAGVDVIAIEQLTERVPEQIGRVPTGQRSLALADRRAQRVDDDRFADLRAYWHACRHVACLQSGLCGRAVWEVASET